MDRIAKLKEMLATSPADNFLEHALALEQVKAGDDNDARLLFERILRRNPSYVGSYYHLGKLLERAGDYAFAILTYQNGMLAAKAAADNHSYNELAAALEEITDV